MSGYVIVHMLTGVVFKHHFQQSPLLATCSVYNAAAGFVKSRDAIHPTGTKTSIGKNVAGDETYAPYAVMSEDAYKTAYKLITTVWHD